MKLSSFSVIGDAPEQKAIKQNFLQEFPASADSGYIKGLLQTAYSEQNADDVEFSLYIGFAFDLFSEEFAEILCKLVVADFHYRHEDIVSVLQTLEAPNIADSIYNAALLKLEYLGYSDTAPLAGKCIRALGRMGTAEAKGKIHLLANSECEVIKNYAMRQLDK
jgi:hypothetical protein